MSKVINYDREFVRIAEKKRFAIFGVGVRMLEGPQKDGGLIMHLPPRRASFICQIAESMAIRRDEPLSAILAEFVPILQAKEAEEAKP